MNISHKTSSFFSLGFFIFLGLVGSAYLVSSSFERVKLAHQTISVKGLAEQAIEADMAIWSGSFSVKAPTLKEVYALYEQAEKDMFLFLAAHGFSSTQDFRRDPLNLIRHQLVTDNGVGTTKLSHYEIIQSYTFESNDVKRIEQLTSVFQEIVSLGIEINHNSPRYIYTKLDDIKSSLLSKAAKDALERAKKMAEATGSGVGALRDARQGVFQITPANSQDVSDYGFSDTSSIKKTAKAIVTMSFALEN